MCTSRAEGDFWVGDGLLGQCIPTGVGGVIGGGAINILWMPRVSGQIGDGFPPCFAKSRDIKARDIWLACIG